MTEEEADDLAYELSRHAANKQQRAMLQRHQTYMLSKKLHPRTYERLMQFQHATPQRTQ